MLQEKFVIPNDIGIIILGNSILPSIPLLEIIIFMDQLFSTRLLVRARLIMIVFFCTSIFLVISLCSTIEVSEVRQ